MLVFISDLHFVDGTAGEHNVPVDGFRMFFETLASKVDWLSKQNRMIEEIKIVFLGDIFDLLRTEMWFKFEKNERPWGNDAEKIEAHAKTIFDALVRKNKATFDLLKGDLKNSFGFPVEPQRIYIPGNHDRLCNKYESLRNKVCKCLGIEKRKTR